MLLDLDRHSGAIVSLAVRQFANRRKAAAKRSTRAPEVAMDLADLEQLAQSIEAQWLKAYGKGESR